MIFPELMAEMRRPHDFIRSMALAQALIITCCESLSWRCPSLSWRCPPLSDSD